MTLADRGGAGNSPSAPLVRAVVEDGADGGGISSRQTDGKRKQSIPTGSHPFETEIFQIDDPVPPESVVGRQVRAVDGIDRWGIDPDEDGVLLCEGLDGFRIEDRKILRPF